MLGPSALAAGLCFYGLGSRSIWLDESASISIASQHGAALGAAMAHDGGNMIVYYALLHVLIGAFGNGIVVIRAPSAIASACTVALTSLFAKRFFGNGVAAATGLLSAVSLPLVFWGQDARAYAIMTALVAASFLAFVTLVEAEPSTRARMWAFAAYVAATTLSMYMSFIAVLVVPAQLLALRFHRRRLWPVLSALALSALLCVPLAVLATGRGAGQLFWVPRPNFSGLVSALEELTSSGLQPQFALTATSYALLGLSLILLTAAGVGAVRAWSRRRDDRAAFAQVLVVCWLVIPFLLALVESEVGQSVFVPRNLLISLPAAGIVLALVASRLPRLKAEGWANKRTFNLGALLVVVLIALRALQLAPSYGTSPEDWHSAVVHVLARDKPGDCVAFYPSDGRMAFEYYIGQIPHALRSAPRPVLPTAPWGRVVAYVEDYATLSPAAVAKLTASCPRLWFVASHQGMSTGTAGAVAHWSAYRQLRAALEARYRFHETTSFGYADPVAVELLAR